MSNAKFMNLPITKLRSNDKTVDLSDPRSPSSDFRRTPIRVLSRDLDAGSNKHENGRCVNVERTFHLYSTPSNSSDRANLAKEVLQRRLSSSSLVSMEDSFSFYSIDSDTRDSSTANISSLICEDSENGDKLIDKPMLNSLGESENKNANDNRKLSRSNDDDSIAEKNFRENTKSPQNSNQSELDTPNKKRNPLEQVEVNSLHPVTPLSRSSPNVKQWKRIREERQKLGLACDENFALPLYDVTASAPGKLMIRKQKMYTEFN